MQNGQLCTSCCSRVIVNIDIAGFVYNKSSSRAKWRTNSERLVRITLKNPKQNKKRDGSRDANDHLRDLLEWLEEFTDTELHAPAHISQDSDSERPTKLVSKSRKHRIYTHFPKDRNCEVCLRTTMTRAPCRRRTGEALPRAEEFDLITADYKVFNEESESRNNHRYAVVVQDLATQWIQSYPCKTMTSKETERVYESSSSRHRSQKLFILTIQWNLQRSSHDLSWKHRTSTPHRSETNGIAERAVRRVKEGTSAVLLQSRLDERWWADSM